MRHAGDETNPTNKTWHRKRFAGIIFMVLDFAKRGVFFPYHGQHLLVAEHLALTPFIAIERHVFDEPDFKILLPTHLDKWYDLPLVDPSHDHTVDFQLDTRTKLVHLQDSINALSHSLEPFSPRHDLELERIKRVQTKIHARQACISHAVQLPMERYTVGRQAQLSETLSP